MVLVEGGRGALVESNIVMSSSDDGATVLGPATKEDMRMGCEGWMCLWLGSMGWVRSRMSALFI